MKTVPPLLVDRSLDLYTAGKRLLLYPHLSGTFSSDRR